MEQRYALRFQFIKELKTESIKTIPFGLLSAKLYYNIP